MCLSTLQRKMCTCGGSMSTIRQTSTERLLIGLSVAVTVMNVACPCCRSRAWRKMLPLPAGWKADSLYSLLGHNPSRLGLASQTQQSKVCHDSHDVEGCFSQ